MNSTKEDLLEYVAELEDTVESLRCEIAGLLYENRVLNSEIDDLISDGRETPSMSYKY